MIRFNTKAVLLMGCLFVVSFSQGCTALDSASQSSMGGMVLGNYDVKEKEDVPMVDYVNYNTTGTIGVNAQISGSSTSTLTKQNTVEGVASGIDRNNGTGEETEVITKNKNGQVAVRKAIKGNKELANTTAKRKAIVNYALQWVGNKYHYGGTSLTKGIDCSGFTMRIMEHFGIKIDRSSDDQHHNGKSTGKPKPGDIICYSGHVAIYIGDGKIVHASNEAAYPRGGIKISSNYKYRTIDTIRNVID